MRWVLSQHLQASRLWLFHGRSTLSSAHGTGLFQQKYSQCKKDQVPPSSLDLLMVRTLDWIIVQRPEVLMKESMTISWVMVIAAKKKSPVSKLHYPGENVSGPSRTHP